MEAGFYRWFLCFVRAKAGEWGGERRESHSNSCSCSMIHKT